MQNDANQNILEQTIAMLEKQGEDWTALLDRLGNVTVYRDQDDRFLFSDPAGQLVGCQVNPGTGGASVLASAAVDPDSLVMFCHPSTDPGLPEYHQARRHFRPISLADHVAGEIVFVTRLIADLDAKR